ncbi:dihydrofolate reductase family protein [Nocardia sp. CDC153]|uniref:dihydrofolate reductase family protein n=1 Tax=Nocardia sp. CDC153 TaxID=3112167 RepID=UPI002DB6F4CC|nr:dihydrofolate reductase family protein [Nocardia sp. CDC153]MEC3951430.1 dihydrofolate reductase family protein [Nocardia sp. CDC153]
MRKVVAFSHMTLDGFAAAHTGMGLEWTFHGYSPDLAAFHDEHIRADVGTTVYGRKTFEGMRDHWSSVPDNPDASAHDLEHAAWVTAIDKLVFSTTLTDPRWNNTRVIGADAAARVAELKAEDGGALVIYGSPTLVHWFAEQGFIDEYRIVIHPVTIGAGTPLFRDKTALTLNLLESKTFDSGAVYVNYTLA